LATEVELEGGVSPEEEEESSISSTSKPLTDMKVTATLLEHITLEDPFKAPDCKVFPQLMFSYRDYKSIISALNFLGLRFSLVKGSIPLLP
jgi:hypothetical protein